MALLLLIFILSIMTTKESSRLLQDDGKEPLTALEEISNIKSYIDEKVDKLKRLLFFKKKQERHSEFTTRNITTLIPTSREQNYTVQYDHSLPLKDGIHPSVIINGFSVDLSGLYKYFKLFSNTLDEIIHFKDVQEATYFFFCRFYKKVGKMKRSKKDLKRYSKDYKKHLVRFVILLKYKIKTFSTRFDELILDVILREYKTDLFLIGEEHLKISNEVFGEMDENPLFLNDSINVINIYQNNVKYELLCGKNIFLYLFYIIKASEDSVLIKNVRKKHSI